MTLHTYTPQPMCLPISYTLQFLRYITDKLFLPTSCPSARHGWKQHRESYWGLWGNKPNARLPLVSLSLHNSLYSAINSKQCVIKWPHICNISLHLTTLSIGLVYSVPVPTSVHCLYKGGVVNIPCGDVCKLAAEQLVILGCDSKRQELQNAGKLWLGNHSAVTLTLWVIKIYIKV